MLIEICAKGDCPLVESCGPRAPWPATFPPWPRQLGDGALLYIRKGGIAPELHPAMRKDAAATLLSN